MIPEQQDIHQLVRGAKEGESMSWNLLYQIFYPKLYALALQLSRSNLLAEDLVQESFVAAYLKLYQLKEPAAFGGWLKKILTHIHLRRVSAVQKVQVINDELLPGMVENDSKFDTIATRSALYAGVAALPDLLRTTLLLRYFSSQSSYDQIARLLKIPVGTVRSRLNEAKSKLVHHWKKPVDAGIRIIDEAERWNRFYIEALSGLHQSELEKTHFFSHLDKQVKVVTGPKDSISDRSLFERMVHEDVRVGSFLKPINVITSGNISIIESMHFNSKESPNHCPPRSFMILHREKKQVAKLQILIA